jgi:DNA-binding GntR family transcriptional regulator
MRAAKDPLGESTADTAFHETIVEAARNQTLATLWQRLQPHARTFISLTMPAFREGSVAARHEPILAALRARDPEAADAAMREHLQDAADRLKAQGER